MSAIEPSWGAPLLSSANPDARATYREGVVALVAGLPHARALFERAVELDPDFFLARVGGEVAQTAPGDRRDLPETPTHLTLGERQHVAVVRAHLAGDLQRALDLRRQHLADLPGDLLVVWLPCGHGGVRETSGAPRRVGP